MSKRLCKLSRADIAQNMGMIYSIVSEAKYVCRSCARASQQKASLCKPMTIAARSSSTPLVKAPHRTSDNSRAQLKENRSLSLSEELSKKERKRAQKETKKQLKSVKKLAKLAKKQSKLLKKIDKAERLYAQYSVVNDDRGHASEPKHVPFH